MTTRPTPPWPAPPWGGGGGGISTSGRLFLRSVTSTPRRAEGRGGSGRIAAMLCGGGLPGSSTTTDPVLGSCGLSGRIAEVGRVPSCADLRRELPRMFARALEKRFHQTSRVTTPAPGAGGQRPRPPAPAPARRICQRPALVALPPVDLALPVSAPPPWRPLTP